MPAMRRGVLSRLVSVTDITRGAVEPTDQRM
jgi:hypothetical protein